MRNSVPMPARSENPSVLAFRGCPGGMLTVQVCGQRIVRTSRHCHKSRFALEGVACTQVPNVSIFFSPRPSSAARKCKHAETCQWCTVTPRFGVYDQHGNLGRRPKHRPVFPPRDRTVLGRTLLCNRRSRDLGVGLPRERERGRLSMCAGICSKPWASTQGLELRSVSRRLGTGAVTQSVSHAHNMRLRSAAALDCSGEVGTNVVLFSTGLDLYSVSAEVAHLLCANCCCVDDAVDTFLSGRSWLPGSFFPLGLAEQTSSLVQRVSTPNMLTRGHLSCSCRSETVGQGSDCRTDALSTWRSGCSIFVVLILVSRWMYRGERSRHRFVSAKRWSQTKKHCSSPTSEAIRRPSVASPYRIVEGIIPPKILTNILFYEGISYVSNSHYIFGHYFHRIFDGHSFQRATSFHLGFNRLCLLLFKLAVDDTPATEDDHTQ